MSAHDSQHPPHDSKPGTVNVEGQPYKFHIHTEDGRHFIDIKSKQTGTQDTFQTPGEFDAAVKNLSMHLDKAQHLTTQEINLVTGFIKASQQGMVGP